MAQERLEEIRQARLQKRAALIERGGVPYPSEAKRTHTVGEVLQDFEALSKDEMPITLTGRLTAIRKHGGVAFMDLADASGTLQLQVSKTDMPEELFARLEDLDIGDFIEAAGKMGQTQRGVKTLLVIEFHLLSKSIRPLPSTWFGLKDTESRFREREVDLLLNKEGRELIQLRSRIIAWVRQRFTDAGFLEVETPILQPIAGGAAAQPFITHHETLDTDLYLRIAPELYLKRLLVGGFEKVFEIGRNFRNEGMDREHNPEFTMLEAYWAYADYEDQMDFVEGMIHDLVVQMLGTEILKHGEDDISFALPMKRLRYIDIVSEAIGFNILDHKDPAKYEQVFKQRHLELPAIRTYEKLVDEFYKEVVRPTLIQPTLLYDYPAEITPLAKQSTTDDRVVEKFQLLVAGSELTNAYTELNDPVIQQQRFMEQQAARDQGDLEASEVDGDFVRAMEYGMPPATGLGMGIDRLVWLLGQAGNIRETIAFPLLKPKQ